MKRARSTLIAAFAGGGVLAAHSLGYVFAARENPHEHGRMLATTGHDYFVYVAALMSALAVFLLSRYTSRRLSDRTTPEISGVQLFAQAGVRMIPLQAIVFLLLESIERVFFAGGVTNILAESAVQLGLVFQVVVALAGALLLSAFAGAVEAVRRRTRFTSARRRLTRVYPKPSSRHPRRLVFAEGGNGLRGPPSI